MNTGGICIGCTMPGFPDRFAPFYKRPPGTIVSSTTSRTVGSFIRPLRRITMEFNNREPLWDTTRQVPSGWANVPEPGPVKKGIHYFYQKWQHLSSAQPGQLDRANGHADGYADAADAIDTTDGRELVGAGSLERAAPDRLP